MAFVCMYFSVCRKMNIKNGNLQDADMMVSIKDRETRQREQANVCSGGKIERATLQRFLTLIHIHFKWPLTR